MLAPIGSVPCLVGGSTYHFMLAFNVEKTGPRNDKPLTVYQTRQATYMVVDYNQRDFHDLMQEFVSD